MQPTTTSTTASNPSFVRTVLPSLEVDSPSPASSSSPTEAAEVPTTPETPITFFEEQNGRPYLADVLEMTNIYGVSGFESELSEIDAYVLDQIHEQGYKATKESYTKILDGLRAQLGIDHLLDYPAQITKLATYIDLERQAQEVAAQKRALGIE